MPKQPILILPSLFWHEAQSEFVTAISLIIQSACMANPRLLQWLLSVSEAGPLRAQAIRQPSFSTDQAISFTTTRAKRLPEKRGNTMQQGKLRIFSWLQAYSVS